MEYLPGGNLLNLLIKKVVFSEESAKFYIAEILLALNSVH
jgi:serine/threonine kinase 38